MQPLWTPSAEAVRHAHLTTFGERVAAAHGAETSTYRQLWEWSIANPDEFWSAAWDFCKVLGEKGDVAFVAGRDIRSAEFFPGARLSVAENMLREPDERVAVVFVGEDGRRQTLTRRELYDRVSSCVELLRAHGIGRGDRVAGVVANTPEALIAMLAVASVGAIWSSCSPDFGVDGIVDRFGQIDPAALFATTAYYYGGKAIDIRPKLTEVVDSLPSLRLVVSCDYAIPDAELTSGSATVSMVEVLAERPPREIDFEPMRFADPLYILFSSGTTGKPKCIVHSGGGVLLQHLKEHQFHHDVRPDDLVFFFSTCGWMMWNWLVSVLASKAAILLYDGNPMHPELDRLPAVAAAERVTVLGVSAKYIDAMVNANVVPAGQHDLTSLRSVLSTGSPLAAAGFEYLCRDWKPGLHVGSISGGTDICGVFVGANPTLPVYAGEIQCPYLGLDVRVFDADGQPIVDAPGELVCRNPHPSMPVGFWNDADGSRYRAAYFEPWPDIWRHGDWITETPHGGYIIEGRSDATLNPKGVRIGTAEIYRQVERLPEIGESLAIGQAWAGDTRIVLFVKLNEGVRLTEELESNVRQAIRTGASPRHVPEKIVAVAELPRTRSGKIAELAVRDVVHGREVRNLTALVDPTVLDLFRDLPELQA